MPLILNSFLDEASKVTKILRQKSRRLVGSSKRNGSKQNKHIGSFDNEVFDIIQDPQPLDVAVAENLVNMSESNQRDDRSSFTMQRQSDLSFMVDGVNQIDVEPRTGHKTNCHDSDSGHSSGTSHHVEMKTQMLGVSSNRDYYISEYDKMAKQHGLQLFSESFMMDCNTGRYEHIGTRHIKKYLCPNDHEKSISRVKTWLLKKHHRSTRRASLGSIADVSKSRSKGDFLGKDIDEIIRLGGSSCFDVPNELSPGSLMIPTSISAAASYIFKNGLYEAGIFRIPRSSSITNQLYDSFSKFLVEDNDTASILHTESSPKLPTNIEYSIHEVASLLKKILASLQGGIIGSPPVFHTLYDISEFVIYQVDSELELEYHNSTRAKMIALALSTLPRNRLAIVCAIIGLLTAINISTDTVAQENAEQVNVMGLMDSEALSIVFGPLLLGDETDEAMLRLNEERSGLLILPTAPGHSYNTLDTTNKHSTFHDIKLSVERSKKCSQIMEMLIVEWVSIVYWLRSFEELLEAPAANRRFSHQYREDNTNFPSKRSVSLHSKSSVISTRSRSIHTTGGGHRLQEQSNIPARRGSNKSLGSVSLTHNQDKVSSTFAKVNPGQKRGSSLKWLETQRSTSFDETRARFEFLSRDTDKETKSMLRIRGSEDLLRQQRSIDDSDVDWTLRVRKRNNRSSGIPIQTHEISSELLQGAHLQQMIPAKQETTNDSLPSDNFSTSPINRIQSIDSPRRKSYTDSLRKRQETFKRTSLSFTDHEPAEGVLVDSVGSDDETSKHDQEDESPHNENTIPVPLYEQIKQSSTSHLVVGKSSPVLGLDVRTVSPSVTPVSHSPPTLPNPDPPQVQSLEEPERNFFMDSSENLTTPKATPEITDSDNLKKVQPEERQESGIKANNVGRKSSGTGQTTTLYAETKRLQGLLDNKSRQLEQALAELQTRVQVADAMSKKMTQKDAEILVWKNRAEWAEKKLKAAL